MRRRHAAYFAALAEQSYERRFDAEAEWSARLDLDHDDLRAALDWFGHDDSDRALELAGALGWYWFSHGLFAEGSSRLSAALAASTTGGRTRARALTGAGSLVARLGDVEHGRRQLDDAIALWRDLGDLDELAAALDVLGWLLVYDAGDGPGSLEAFEQSLDLHRVLGDGRGELRSTVGVAQVLVALGEVDRAETLSRQLLELGAGDPRTEHFAYHFLADCALIRRDAAEAEKRYRESLLAALQLGDVIETSLEVQGVAMAAARGGDPERGLRLAGSVEALWESLGTSLSVAFWDALLETHIGAVRRELGARAEELWKEGRAMTFDEAVASALGNVPE